VFAFAALDRAGDKSTHVCWEWLFVDQFDCNEELELYRRLLAETIDEEQRRALFLLIACAFEQDELSSGVSLKSVAATVSSPDLARLQ
jgi:hypothetical protein